MVAREPLGEGGSRLLHDEPHGALVRRLDPIDALYLGTEVGGRFLGGDLFERPFYVRTGDGFAVVKYGIAQLEQPGSRAISDPGLGEFRAKRALGVVGE